MAPRKLFYRIGLGVVAAVLLFFAYRTFFPAGDQDAPGADRPRLTALGLTPTAPLDQATNEFLQILLSLQKIELSPQFFSNPVFAGLVDFSTELQPQSPGRVNPFAPIGSAPATSSSPRGGGVAPAGGASGGAGDDALRNELLRALNQ